MTKTCRDIELISFLIKLEKILCFHFVFPFIVSDGYYLILNGRVDNNRLSALDGSIVVIDDDAILNRRCAWRLPPAYRWMHFDACLSVGCDAVLD